MGTLHDEHRLVSAHRCVCGWEGDSALTHLLDVLQIEEVDGRILPTGSLVGGLANYEFDGARKLYTIGGLPGAGLTAAEVAETDSREGRE